MRWNAIVVLFWGVLCVTAVGLEAGDLQAGDGKTWYKGVTHFHTLWSDGNGAPEVAVQWYRDAGYDFVCVSDHNIFQAEERWFAVSDEAKSRLTTEKVDALRGAFGDDWVETRTRDGKTEMRLKTYDDLVARFEAPGEYLLIPGEEVTSPKAVHINALNIRATIPAADGPDPVTIMRKDFAAIEAHGRDYRVPVLAHLNHPNFADAITAEEIVAIGGERFFEVYNGHGSVRNWGDAANHIVSTDRLWDIVLSLRLGRDGDTRRPMYALASDDAHNWFYRGVGSSIPGRGWIVVLAEELSTEALIAAMNLGHHYASSGVRVERIVVSDEGYAVHIAAEPGVTYTTRFIGTPKDADLSAEPVRDDAGNPIRATHRYGDDVGKVFLETTDNPAVYRFTGEEMYVRAKVTSSKPVEHPTVDGDLQEAWLQPVCRVDLR